MSIFVRGEKISKGVYPSNVQTKHRAEYDAVIDDVLQEVFDSLIRAANRFNSVINDRYLQNEFTEGVNQAKEVLLKLDLKKDDGIERE